MGTNFSKSPEIKKCDYCNKTLKINTVNTGVSSAFVYYYLMCNCNGKKLEKTVLNSSKYNGLNS